MSKPKDLWLKHPVELEVEMVADDGSIINLVDTTQPVPGNFRRKPMKHISLKDSHGAIVASINSQGTIEVKTERGASVWFGSGNGVLSYDVRAMASMCISQERGLSMGKAKAIEQVLTWTGADPSARRRLRFLCDSRECVVETPDNETFVVRDVKLLASDYGKE
jgi:hypothetical protein